MKRLVKSTILLLTVVLFFASCKTVKQPTGFVPPAEIPLSEGILFVKNMGTGINIGNTLDTITDRDGPGTDETGWGNPKITRQFIRALKNYGYKTIRLPITWAEHMALTPDYTIEKWWIDRVEEVVEWCLEEDLYVIINLHHDGGTSKTSWILDAWQDYDGVEQRLCAVWSQIAMRFRDYPHKLLFEAMNEVGFDKDWNNRYTILNGLNQAFVDTVRGTGGNNADRWLLASGYWTDIEASCHPEYKLPKDDKNRIILSVHYYTPSSFAISGDPSNKYWYRYDWGTNDDYMELQGKFNMLYEHFLSQGKPVIMGEYGAVKGKDENSRIEWLRSVCRICLDYNILPIMWDTGIDISRYEPFPMSDQLQKVYAGIPRSGVCAGCEQE